MARPGVAQKEQKIGRTPNGEWVLVPSAPFKAPKSRDMPKLLVGSPVRPEVRKWWSTIKSMPHCVLWAESDWDYAMDTAILKQEFYAAPKATLSAEIRHREDQMGTTVEARRKLGIRYISPDVVAPVSSKAKAAKTAKAVSSLDERRARLTSAS